MLNLKKLGIGLGVVACLATSSFAFENEDNVCKVINHSGDYILTPSLNYQYNKLSAQDFVKNTCSTTPIGKTLGSGSSCFNNLIVERVKYQAELFQQEHGALSTDMIKDIGIGVSVNKGWETVYQNMFTFEGELSKEDKEEYLKMYVSGIINKKNYDSDDAINMARFIYNKQSYYKIFRTSSEAVLEGNQFMKPFFKYVVNHDFERAKKYMYEFNRKNGITKGWNEVKSYCINKNLGTTSPFNKTKKEIPGFFNN